MVSVDKADPVQGAWKFENVDGEPIAVATVDPVARCLLTLLLQDGWVPTPTLRQSVEGSHQHQEAKTREERGYRFGDVTKKALGISTAATTAAATAEASATVHNEDTPLLQQNASNQVRCSTTSVVTCLDCRAVETCTVDCPHGVVRWAEVLNRPSMAGLLSCRGGHLH